MLDYIFIDLDGTIIWGWEKHYNCYVTIVNEYGGIPISFDEYWFLKRNKVKRAILLEKTKFGGSYNDYINRWIELIESKEMLLLDKITLDNKKALNKLKAFTGHLILVTMRHNSDNLIWQLKKLEIKHIFDDIIIVDGQRFKNKYDAVNYLKSTKTLVIGDTEEDEILAEKLSADFVAITSGLRDKSYLKSKHFIDTLSDIFLLL